MDKKQVLKYGAVGVGVITVILILMRRRDTQTVIAPGDSQTVVPGASASPGFSSTINVDARPDSFAGLSNRYMALFGMVGSGVPSGPGKTETKIIINQNILPAIARQAYPTMLPPAIPTYQDNRLRMSVGTKYVN